MLRALAEAAAGRYQVALDLSRPALAYDSAGRAGDPFFRAALHVVRGDWYLASNQSTPADASWLWYQNLDVVGWPTTVAQAGEVDWALGTLARWRRGNLAASEGRRAEGCRMMDQVMGFWSQAESSIAPLRAEAGRILRQCSN